MDNLESIDKYLVSEIDGIETIPSDQLWNSIETKMEAGKAARKIRSRRWKIASAASLAVATVALITYATLSEHKPSSNNIASIDPVTTSVQNNAVPLNEDQQAAKTTSNETKTTSGQQNPKAAPIITSKKDDHKTVEATTDLNDISLDEKQELPAKPAIVTTTSPETKKDNSDKSIIMLPYFAPNYAGSNTTQNDKATIPPPSVNAKIDQAGESTTKVDPRENTIYMPNAFTPNGDGLNDVFLPQTTETPSEYKLSVFDRTGSLVFFSDDIQKGWDGRINKNGLEEIREDVYIWRIEMKTAKGEKRHLMGSLTLLK